MSKHQAVLDRISKAKIKMMLNGSEAFLSSLVLALNTTIDESIPTACTDGIQVKYNPEFVDGLNDKELKFLVAHETWHVAFMHMVRIGGRDPKKWNIAADHVINLMLKEQGYTLIQGALADPQYKGMSTEEVYDKLPNDVSNINNPQDGDFEGPGQSGDGEGNSGDGDGDGGNQPNPNQQGNGAEGMTEKEVEQAIEDAIIKAATQAQMSNKAGSIPGHIARMVDEILNPKLPWNVILQQYMSAKSKTEKSWSRRNKRFRTTYLPSKLSESMGDVNIYVDASGSVSQDEFQAYIAEMHDIRESLRPEVMKVISFDTSLKDEFIMEKGEDIDVHFTGGGGTMIEPVVAHAEKEDEVDVTIIFTDGYFSNVDYTRIPNDVLWVIVNNPSWECPHGTVIHMEHKPEM